MDYDYTKPPNTRRVVITDEDTVIIKRHWVPEDPTDPDDCARAEEFNRVNSTLTFKVKPGTLSIHQERDIETIRDAATGKAIELKPIDGSERFTISGFGVVE